MLERYLVPLSPYALLALAAVVGLFILVSVEREIRRLKARLGKENKSGRATADAGHDQLQIKLDDLSVRLREAEERYRAPAPAPATKPGLNMNKRNQVIRMSRRGQPATNIAAALSMPRKEVELLLKIHGLSASKPSENAS
jgi:hypothetical protein